MPATRSTYRGRFAPSPTGPLHLGSLVAALASYLDARQHGGQWLLRMEDLDPPREIPGAADSILDSLHNHGLHWNEPVLFQSTRKPAYAQALAALGARGLLFRCDCNRGALNADGACNGNCRQRQEQLALATATRVTVATDCSIQFDDRLLGPQQHQLAQSTADFVVRRKDGLDAYQLAVVVDDADQAITHVVRGSDLLDSTPRQIYLQQCLHLPTPRYCHLPLITTALGQKFSKQNHAPALSNDEATTNLRQALRFLNQVEPDTNNNSVDELLAQAATNWSIERIPAELAIAASSIGMDA